MGEVHEEARRRRQRILAMGPDLPTRQEVADELGVSLKTITNDISVMRGAGAKLTVQTSGRFRCDEATKAAVRASYANGEYIEDICTKHGVSWSQVRNYCRDLPSPKKSTIRPVAKVHAYTIRRKSFISTTYAATTTRARQVQEAIHRART